MAAGCDPCRQPLGGGPIVRLSTDVILPLACLRRKSSFFYVQAFCTFTPVNARRRKSHVKLIWWFRAMSCQVTFSPFYVLITSSNARFELLVPFKKYPSPHHFCITKQDILPCPSASPTIPTRPPKPSRIRSWKHVTVSSDPRYTRLMCLFCCLLIVCHWPPYPRGTSFWCFLFDDSSSGTSLPKVKAWRRLHN